MGDPVGSLHVEDYGMSITIYGASDDMVEVEGEISEEFNPRKFDEPSYITTSDGTFLRITYDGLWNITVLKAGEGTHIEHRKATDEENDYSDRVTLKNNAGFEFVLFGDGIAKKRKQS